MLGRKNIRTNRENRTMEEWKKFELIPWLFCLLVCLVLTLLFRGKSVCGLWILAAIAGVVVFISKKKIQKDKDKEKPK